MTTALAKADPRGEAIESLIVRGDLSQLNPTQRAEYYARVCDSLGLNPLTKPFEYVKLSGREVLYARKDATEQLRKRDKVSLEIVARELAGGVYAVTARAKTPDGRTDESIGAVAVENLRGEALANAFMKAETKAKRRVTLSICGLGMLDETEVADIPEAKQAAPAPAPAPKPPAPALPVASEDTAATLEWLLTEYGRHHDCDAEMVLHRLCAAAGWVGICSTADLSPDRVKLACESLRAKLDGLPPAAVAAKLREAGMVG